MCLLHYLIDPFSGTSIEVHKIYIPAEKLRLPWLILIKRTLKYWKKKGDKELDQWYFVMIFRKTTFEEVNIR